MAPIRVGVQLQPQHTTYAAYADAVRAADELGVDTIWNWDHFFPLTGDPNGLHFEGWSLLAAMAAITSRAEIGCLVTCNSYRNPNLLADMARTVDHISNGRLILGIGAGWFEKDYATYGYEFGTAPDRLRALRAALPVIKERLGLLNPPPMRDIPLLIGGGGEKVTLKLTAQYATMWNGFGPAESFKHKNEVLNEWCRELGRDPGEIERTVMVNEAELDNLQPYLDAGATHIITGLSAPHDLAPAKKLVAWRDAQ